MAGYSVELRELAQMTDAEEAEVLTQLVSSARGRRNGQVAGISARIRSFERRYEMSSDKLLECLKAGKVRETAEISEWLFMLSARDRQVGG